MKRHWNWITWAGFAIALFAFFSYLTLFIRFPVTRDFPWANLLLFAIAGVLLGIGLYRAYARPSEYRGKIVGPVLAVLSLAMCAFFGFGAFYFARLLPPAERALRVGRPAPDFTLPDSNGKMVQLSRLREGKAGTLLIFYRGYW